MSRRCNSAGIVSVCTPRHPLHKQYLDEDKIYRSGIIPYTRINGEISVLLGVKHPYKDQPGHPGRRTDFGGHAKLKETIHECSMREFREESGGCIKEPDKDKLTLVTFQYKGKLHAMLLYEYNNYMDDYATFNFVSNEEIAYIRWYPLSDVYFERNMNDMGLEAFVRSTPINLLYAIL